jgi:hypothetical protein
MLTLAMIAWESNVQTTLLVQSALIKSRFYSGSLLNSTFSTKRAAARKALTQQLLDRPIVSVIQRFRTSGRRVHRSMLLGRIGLGRAMFGFWVRRAVLNGATASFASLSA